MKPIMCIDFDAVIHRPDSGWEGIISLTDPAVPKAMEFIVNAAKHFNVDIFSEKQSSEPLGRRAMWMYLKDNLEPVVGPYEASRLVSIINFPVNEPAAVIKVDDKGITITAAWADIESLFEVSRALTGKGPG